MTATINDDGLTWVDAEVHLIPPEWCGPRYQPPESEKVMRRVVYEHPERELALPSATIEGALAEMERAGIDRAVITGLPWRDPELCWRNTAYVAQAVRQCPDRFIGLGLLPSPATSNPADAVRRIAEELGLAGVKVIPSWHSYRLDDVVLESALEHMVEYRLVLMPHTDHAYVDAASGDPASALYNVVCRHPDLRVLAPHLGGLLCLYSLHEPVRQTLNNVLFVTSVPKTMRMVEFAVASIGPEKLAFGTDFPFNPSHDQRTVRAEFESLNLDRAQVRAIAGGNVLRFFGPAGRFGAGR